MASWLDVRLTVVAQVCDDTLYRLEVDFYGMFGRLLIKQVGHVLVGGVGIVRGRPAEEEELVYPRLAGMEHRIWLSPTVSVT